jgi:hypothetical protein
MTSLKKICALCLMVLAFLSCRKSTNANWDVDVVIPVAHSVLDIKNFAGDSLFTTDNTHLLYFNVNRQIAAIKLDSLLNLPDTSVSTSFTLPVIIPFTLNPGQVFPNLTLDDLKFDPGNDISLKKIDVRTGTLSVKFSNLVGRPLDLVYIIPGTTKNGEPFKIVETIPSGTNSLQKSYDISGYSLDMRGATGQKYNTISQSCTLALNPNTTSVTISPGGSSSTMTLAAIEVSYSEITPAYVEGYFGDQTVKVKLDTVNIGLSKNLKAKNFKLSEASMDFDIINEFGAEFSATIFNVAAINAGSGQRVNLTDQQLSSININRASKVGTTIYPTVNSVSFNSLNSNITDFISNLPDQITYQSEIQLNPNKNITGYGDFAFYNTGLRIIAHIKIPLRYTADEFELTTNAATSFSSNAQLDNVNSGYFVITANNGFPFTAQLQGYMYDENNQLLDSLFLQGTNLVEKGVLNGQNEVITPVKSKIYVPVNQSKIENLKKCKTISFVSRFIMPPNPPEMKIFEHYQLEINISAELNYNVGFEN